MPIHIITLAFDSGIEGFANQELQDFLAGKTIIPECSECYQWFWNKKMSASW